MTPDLELDSITKWFGKAPALDNASLKLRNRSIHALLGENGAGKTTLMRIAFGMLAPDSGSIRVRGKLVQLASPADAIQAGIGMVHQQFSLVPEMTVAENVALGGRGKYNRGEVAARVQTIAARIGMKLDPSAKVKTLTASERQKLEIVRTFAHNAAILILDEPTAVLTPRDRGDLFAQLRSFADAGGSVVLITHKLRDALEHADEVTVLRRGRCVLNASMISVNETVLAEAMLGETQQRGLPGAKLMDVPKQSVLELRDISLRDEYDIVRLDRVSLQINAGEIVGVAALDGAAKALLGLLGGRLTPTSGDIIRPRSIGFVPEDRLQDALVPDFSLTENMALQNAGARSGRMNWSEIEMNTASVIKKFGVVAPGTDARTGNLSGGNQQKFVLGRELAEAPALLVLENPTQGLDIHAANAIHEKIRAARNSGTAVVMYSSDLDELAALSDRVLVVNNGVITVSSADRDAIGRLLLATND